MPSLVPSLSIDINIQQQTLTLLKGRQPWLCYRVSTAMNGVGEKEGSGCTPRGRHIVRAKIGQGQPVHSVFVGRRPTGEIFSNKLAKQYPKRDWILSRILWLSGTEIGINRMGDVDTMRRFIYIHGTPESEPMGVPLSHGCIRMKNVDIVDLFDRVSVGTVTTIIES